jgi:hypothetical protein
MEKFSHSITALFEQLGLDSSEEGIDIFTIKHSPIQPNVLLHEAEFWKPSQADFLKQALEEDSDWTGAVDSLNSMLR